MNPGSLLVSHLHAIAATLEPTGSLQGSINGWCIGDTSSLAGCSEKLDNRTMRKREKITRTALTEAVSPSDVLQELESYLMMSPVLSNLCFTLRSDIRSQVPHSPCVGDGLPRRS